ncbi:MAG: DUF4159 domain-containing protein, partial [Nannocystaceae bacterium]
MTSRRKLLALAGGLVAAAVTPRRAQAYQPGGVLAPEDLANLLESFPSAGERLRIDLPQLQYPGNWNPRPGAMRELATELRLRTRLEPRRDPSVVALDSPNLFQTPWLYIAGQG